MQQKIQINDKNCLIENSSLKKQQSTSVPLFEESQNTDSGHSNTILCLTAANSKLQWNRGRTVNV